MQRVKNIYLTTLILIATCFCCSFNKKNCYHVASEARNLFGQINVLRSL